MNIYNLLRKPLRTAFDSTRILILLIFAALTLRVLFIWASLSYLPATSDEASLALLAKMISRGARPLLFIGQPYQFPIESYLMSPFIEWLPRNAIGVRYQCLLLGLLSTVGFIAILRQALPSGLRWPSILLVLFPSAYLLMLTSAYAPPQYSISITLAWMSIFSALRAREKSSIFWFFLAGLCSGLAISNHMLILTVSFGVLALVVFCGSIKSACKNVLPWGLGCAIGITPYLLAILTIPGAYNNLPDSVPITKALAKIWDPAVSKTLAGAMGFNPVVFPDFRALLGWPKELRTIFAGCYLLLFCILAASRGKKHVEALKNCRLPNFKLVDLALITSIFTIFLFVFHRTSTGAYRYVLPAVWCFPFLIGHAYQAFDGRARKAIGTAAVTLAFLNIAASADLISKWNNPAKIQEYADTPSIEHLLKVLNEDGITSCYATFWLAYRITYESDENIVCSLPSNERFMSWPIPYKDQVDRQSNVVYILTLTSSSRLNALNFQQDLESYGVAAQHSKVDNFHVYHDFSLINYSTQNEKILSPEKYSLQTSDSNKEQLQLLKDESYQTAWVSRENQHKGQWLRINFSENEIVNGITLFHPEKPRGFPYSFEIKGYQIIDGHGLWHKLIEPRQSTLEKMRFVNDHPVYLGFSQQIRFAPIHLKALQIEIVSPAENKTWNLSELEISVTDPSK